MTAQQRIEDGVVSIHGKAYKTVARRISDFRQMEAYLGYSLATEVLESGELVVVRATVKTPQGNVIATGHAEEKRGSTNINKTSALENAETSAIGRALAFLDGELAGTEIASADEVANAICQQKDVDTESIRKECWKWQANHMQTFLTNMDSVMCIKEGIQAFLGAGDVSALDASREAWRELDEETQRSLWVAPSKGGVLTTKEREVMTSPEWKQ